MYFSCEYGLRSSPSDCVEPKFFNSDCGLGLLRTYAYDRAMKDMNDLVRCRREIEERNLVDIEPTIAAADSKLKIALENEKKTRQAAILKLREILDKLASVKGVDFSYSDKVGDRLKLEAKDDSVRGHTLIAPLSRTFLIGLTETGEALLMSFELPLA